MRASEREVKEERASEREVRAIQPVPRARDRERGGRKAGGEEGGGGEGLHV